MKLSEAKKIIGQVLAWNFVHMGISEEKPTEKLECSLSDLLLANKIVERANSRAKPNKQGTTKRHMTVDDRLLAGIYVLMNYEGGSAENASSITEYFGKFLFVIRHEN